MSVSPLQNFLNPPPVPDMPMTNRADPPMESPQSSTIASVIGKTVLEPSMSVVSAPHATRNAMAQKKAVPQAFQPGERLKIHFHVFIQQKLYDGPKGRAIGSQVNFTGDS
jgi:hypothetical protein